MLLATIFLDFFLYSCQWRQFFRLIETYSLTNSPFPLVETDFVYSWNNIHLIIFWISLCGNRKFNFWKTTLFLLVETAFLDSGNHFFLQTWDTSATASFIFSSSRNVFLDTLWLVETHFLTNGNDFFLNISANDVVFSSSGNVVSKRILHSG